MNKKISTLLTAGLLVTSALCGSVWAQTPLTINGIELETVADPAAVRILLLLTWMIVARLLQVMFY